jgi:hypothetical protein
MNSDEAQCRAAALFKKKEQQSREAQQAMTDYQAELHATREKTARLRALRLARDAANQGRPPAGQKDAAQPECGQKKNKRLGRTEHRAARINSTGSH